jgi:hypothetical protein
LQVNSSQNLDYFSEALSVARYGGDLFGKHLDKLQVNPAKLLAFVLKHGKVSVK